LKVLNIDMGAYEKLWLLIFLDLIMLNFIIKLMS
jgi:hypothetical protein